jgi:hypothetical protein
MSSWKIIETDNMKKIALLILAMSVIAGCRKQSGGEGQTGEKPSLGLYSYMSLQDTQSGDLTCVGAAMCYDVSAWEVLTGAFDMTIEQTSGPELLFLPHSSEAAPTISTDMESEYYDNVFARQRDWLSIWTSVTYDYWRDVMFKIQQEGDYEFRLKFHLHEGDQTVYSPTYRLTVKLIPNENTGTNDTMKYCYEGTYTVIEQ